MQLKYHMVTIEDPVPEDHLLRKLERSLDMSFVHEETSHLYSRKYGRPPIDPVVMVKYLLVGFLYGIPSERQIEERCRDSNALRWYLGIDLDERVPDHSTISQLRRRKPGFRKIFRRLFEEVVRQCVEQGLVSGGLAVTDSTHVRANAARASEYEVDVQAEAGNYWKRLDAYEEEGLEELRQRTGKRRAKRTKQIKKDKRRPRKKVSHTDPEAGYMARPGKPNGFYYLSHQTTDPDWGIICPNGKELRPKRLYCSDSGLFWEYWADRRDCACCPLRDKCLSETDKAGARKLQDSYFKHSIQRYFSRRWKPEYREVPRGVFFVALTNDSPLYQQPQIGLHYFTTSDKCD
ncbi:hypothetical protein CE91St41_21430 [Oscillospiraceae bacterium]|nr:hypothetical protein CE91St40_16110 [Oscillospiraceae bacterium]BDF75254.1 hypothetical protein CE91St41_21430 [Oscillospiraceae bacterium]